VYFKVLPYEDSSYIREEMRALKYVQIELLDIQNMDEGLEETKNSSTSHLHKQVFLPFISSVSCGGFYLYGTPLIYTQDLQEDEAPQTPDLFNKSLTKTVKANDFQLPRISSAAGKADV